MSYIDYTRKSSNSTYEVTACIKKEECKTQHHFFKSAYNRRKQNDDKYGKSQEGGEAKEKQKDVKR